jgi:hypothetical protein
MWRVSPRALRRWALATGLRLTEAGNPLPALLVAAICLHAGTRLPASPVRALVVLPLALLTPGAALGYAAFGARRPLAGMPLVALWIILSMALYPLLALCLQLGAYPLTAHNVVVATDTLVLLLLAVTSMRKALPGSTTQRAAPHGMGRRPSGAGAGSGWSGAQQAIRMLFVILGIILVVAVGRAILPAPPPAPFTQVSLDGTWAYLDTVAPGAIAASGVAISVTNHTTATRLYRIEPTVDMDWHWPAVHILIPAGRRWSGLVRGQIPSDRRVHRLRIAVYTSADAVPIGELTLWIRGTARAAGTCPSRLHHGPAAASRPCVTHAALSPGAVLIQAASTDQVPR